MKAAGILRDSLITILALSVAGALSVQLQRMDVEEHITTVFVFAVFLISILTRGYVYGVLASVLGTVAISFVFTYPYFAFDFWNPVSAVSAVIMLLVALISSLLVAKLKRHDAAVAESERERLRANLLRAVSHDLRTPLTTICSASSMLLDNREALSPAQQEALLRTMQENAQWLTRMVENLLTVTRIDNSSMTITKTPTILDELIDAAVSKFTARHPGQKVQLQLPDELVVIPMDTILIEQVLLNLLENAIDHAKGMTVLTIRVFTLGNQAIFEILDDGCGIDEGSLRRLFDGGLELRHDTAQGEKRFAGIGLSVCTSIIRAHGGSISAENRRSGGALVRFTLELEKEDAAHGK